MPANLTTREGSPQRRKGRWGDPVLFNIKEKTISVTKQVYRINGELVVNKPKTHNSVRTLAIPQKAVSLLVEEHMKHPSSPYMFPSPKTGGMFDPDSFRHTHDKILKAIGAEHIRFHDLRHPYVKTATTHFSWNFKEKYCFVSIAVNP